MSRTADAIAILLTSRLRLRAGRVFPSSAGTPQRRIVHRIRGINGRKIYARRKTRPRAWWSGLAGTIVKTTKQIIRIKLVTAFKPAAVISRKRIGIAPTLR